MGGCSTDDVQALPPLPPKIAVDPITNDASDAVPELRVVWPESGATVTSPFALEVDVSELRLAPLGDVRDGEGHLHVIVDAPCVEAGEVITEENNHFGHGRPTLDLELPVGEYDLCVQMGDGFHVALAISQSIRVNVVEAVAGTS